MINLITNKIVKYFSDKAAARINADPTGTPKQHFSSIIPVLSIYGEIKSLLWIGSYKYSMDMIKCLKQQDEIDNVVFDKIAYERSTEDEHIIDIFLGKGSGDNWFLAFFADSSDLEKKFVLIDSFKIIVRDEAKLNVSRFTKII